MARARRLPARALAAGGGPRRATARSPPPRAPPPPRHPAAPQARLSGPDACKFIPFSTGRRVCPGARLAEAELAAATRGLLRSVTWRRVGPVDLREEYTMLDRGAVEGKAAEEEDLGHGLAAQVLKERAGHFLDVPNATEAAEASAAAQY